MNESKKINWWREFYKLECVRIYHIDCTDPYRAFIFGVEDRIERSPFSVLFSTVNHFGSKFRTVPFLPRKVSFTKTV
jgi:hypothetical protein